ncbi:BSD domain-containing protein 1, partial [Rhizopus azygosporus]
PEEEQQEQQQQQQANRRIYATRKETLIAKMQANPDTYLKDPENEEETKVLKTFNDTFKIDEYTEEIAQLLNDNPELRDMMNTLVPMQVSYPLFWQRYFYQAWKIDQDEQKRQLIVQSVKEEDENDFKWDSDDEEMTIKDNVKRSSEDTDFSQISNPSSTPQLQSTEDEWVKTETQKKETIKSKNDNNSNNNNDDDDDSDWE